MHPETKIFSALNVISHSVVNSEIFALKPVEPALKNCNIGILVCNMSEVVSDKSKIRKVVSKYEIQNRHLH